MIKMMVSHVSSTGASAGFVKGSVFVCSASDYFLPWARLWGRGTLKLHYLTWRLRLCVVAWGDEVPGASAAGGAFNDDQPVYVFY